MDNASSGSKPIDRVALACIQCRSRHVKCDSSQPVCYRCQRDGKECTYLKSRRGGLDKAALARRRLALQQQQQPRGTSGTQSTPGSSSSDHLGDHIIIRNSNPEVLPSSNIPPPYHASTNLSFAMNTDRLVDLFYENFFPSTPITLPLYFLRERILTQNRQMKDLLLVIHWIGSLYAPWTSSEPYYQQAYHALLESSLPKTGFSVQALLLFSIAQYHSNLQIEARKTLDAAVAMGLELGMNTRDFIRQHGEMNPVLEESWRRTYYFLLLTDQHHGVLSNNPFYKLRDVPVLVDLPCDDEFYEAGQIPPPATLEEYEQRDLADAEVIYSSMAYLYDISRVITYVMRTFSQTGAFNEDLVCTVETKVAVWHSLLPACKKDPLRPDGQVDEIIYFAHMLSAILIMNSHRPYSSLTYTMEELSASSFSSPVPLVNPPRQGRAGHTARSLKAAEVQTKLLTIQCAVEKHHPFTMSISASLAAAQISACNTLLEDHALSIARDRVRLSIGALNVMGSVWELAKIMARDVRYVARMTLSTRTNSSANQVEKVSEVVDILRDEIIWPVNPAAGIDIYSGLVLPKDFDNTLYQPSPSSLFS